MQHLVSVRLHTYVQDPGSLNAPFERTKLERDTFNIAQSSHFRVFNISCTSCCVTQIFRASDSGLLVFKYNRGSVRQSGIFATKTFRKGAGQRRSSRRGAREGRPSAWLPPCPAPAQAGPLSPPRWESQSSGSVQAKGKERHKWERLATCKLRE